MKTLIFIILGNCITIFSFAQVGGTVLDPYPYLKQTNFTRNPSPQPTLREADVMWSKRIWRYIDVNEKLNLSFKYPSMNSSTDRMSLMDVFSAAIQNGTLTPYGYEDDEFTMPITWERIQKRAGAGVDTIDLPADTPPYDPVPTRIERTFSSDKVIGYQLKEEWFFDKQRSVMDVRIIGIAPMIYATDEMGNIREGNYRIPLFWVYYPDARKILCNAEAFNRGNNAQRMTYDDVFQKRFFGSYILKESNVFDRSITEYAQGTSALLESERIKNDIATFEHDMWEF